MKLVAVIFVVLNTLYMYTGMYVHVYSLLISESEKKMYYVAGVDISFVKGDDVNACAAVVVLSFPDLKVGNCFPKCISFYKSLQT
jgi:hypothetical protein